MSSPFVMDENKGYKLILCMANIRHWWKYGEQEAYEFETIDELIKFMRSHGLTDRSDLLRLRKRDREEDHGSIASTSWYEVIKKYRDTPECYLW